MKRHTDHIVYCVPDLPAAIAYLEDLLGIRPVIGGSHLTKGTKNALLNLGNRCYLEILAVDEANDSFEGQRWMGIDLINKPMITRWSLKSENLEEDSRILSEYSVDLGIVNGGNRYTAEDKLLSWKMILPASAPEVELLPFMTDWSDSDVHPTDTLTEGCLLKNIELFHPNSSEIQNILNNLGVENKITKSDEIRIAIEVMSPNGLKRLS